MNNGSRPKFLFKNLGSIKEAELELGDLTIIAGRNNTGKTYIAYALYGFLKQWPYSMMLDAISFTSNPFYQLAEDARKAGMLKLPTDQEALQRRRTELIERITQYYSKYALRGVFSAESEAFASASFAVQLGGSPDLDSDRFESPRLSFKHEDGALIMSVNDSDRMFYLAAHYLTIAFPEFLLDPFILTSERFGISLFHRELDLRRNELVRRLQQMASNDSEKKSRLSSPYDLIEEASSRYARPIHDNINYTRDIPDLANEKSDLYEQKRHDDIKRMMNAYYRVESGGVRFVSTARGERRFNLPLYRASSSARGLSDLYFYMRHAAKEGQLLMVDEPEAHLDTANQVEMARMLARLARSGVKVLVTTHSDYIVKEINNLIMLGRQFEKKEEVAKKYGYDEGECLDPDQVVAYVAENNGLTRCDINDYGLDYPNFDETIREINRRSRAFSQHIWADQEK